MNMLLKRLSALALVAALPLFAWSQEEDQPEVAAPAAESKSAVETPYKDLALFLQVLQLAREHYVDKEDANYKNLLRGAMKGMLQELDPFSIYEEPERYKSTMEGTAGQFGGIGIVVSMRNDVLEVVAPMEDTPGFKAGILAGDVIMEIDGKSTRRMELHDCINLMKGAPGTFVTIKVYRRSDDSTRDFTIERAVISVSPVKNSRLLSDDIGYIRITQFSQPTADELDASLRKLRQSAKLKGLVIDLRGNPGGLLDAAVKVCSRFLEKDELVVSTEGRDEADKKLYRSIPCDKTLDLPIAILVNGNSASASEIVSGCLQDHKRAVIVGTRTFGKGLVQTVIPMPDGGAVRITTSKYYTPKRQMIQGHGIDPDIKVEVSPATEAAIAQQLAQRPGELKSPLAKVKDVQLERAIEILKGVSLFREAKAQ